MLKTCFNSIQIDFFVSTLGVGAENYCRIQDSITPVLWEATRALATRT